MGPNIGFPNPDAPFKKGSTPAIDPPPIVSKEVGPNAGPIPNMGPITGTCTTFIGPDANGEPNTGPSKPGVKVGAKGEPPNGSIPDPGAPGIGPPNGSPSIVEPNCLKFPASTKE